MARNNLVELFDRFSESQSIKDREVLEVRIVSKRGVGRANVKLPSCDQEVLAREPTPIASAPSNTVRGQLMIHLAFPRSSI